MPRAASHLRRRHCHGANLYIESFGLRMPIENTYGRVARGGCVFVLDLVMVSFRFGIHVQKTHYRVGGTGLILMSIHAGYAFHLRKCMVWGATGQMLM